MFLSTSCVFRRLEATLLHRLHRLVVTRAASTSASASAMQPAAARWQLAAAVCLERFPSLTAEMTPIERDYKTFIEQCEDETSLMSAHELRRREDLKAQKRRKSGERVAEEKMARSGEKAIQSAQDFEDAATAEFKRFIPAARRTDADEKNDVRSLRRCLDRKLVLVIQQRLSANSFWVFPEAVHKEGETLRQTAERALYDCCGDASAASFYGNAPVGLYKYKYPKAIKEKTKADGVKIFIFKAQLKPGAVVEPRVSAVIEDYKWLRHDELDESSFVPRFLREVRKILIE